MKSISLVIKLPEKDDRKALVESWIHDLKNDPDFTSFRSQARMLEGKGIDHCGIGCLMLHDGTNQIVRSRFSGSMSKEHLKLAFIKPISLN